MTAIKGVYANLRPVRTRKVWVMEIEIPEEEIKNATDVMGFPNQSESQWVGVALIKDPEPVAIEIKPGEHIFPTYERDEEGAKLRTRAVMLCKDEEFQNFVMTLQVPGVIMACEAAAKLAVLEKCEINSRSEFTHNPEAQEKFKQLVNKFQDWKFENNYSHNLEREYV
jgi:hypothetical protein